MAKIANALFSPDFTTIDMASLLTAAADLVMSGTLNETASEVPHGDSFHSPQLTSPLRLAFFTPHTLF